MKWSIKPAKALIFLMKKNKIDVYHGHGSFITANKIKLTKSDTSSIEIETEL